MLRELNFPDIAARAVWVTNEIRTASFQGTKIARIDFNGNGGDIDSRRGTVIFLSEQILEMTAAFAPLSYQARHGRKRDFQHIAQSE